MTALNRNSRRLACLAVFSLGVTLFSHWLSQRYEFTPNTYPGRDIPTRFYRLCVNDAETQQPIADASVKVICMGKEPAVTTDAQGWATVRYFERAPFVVVKIDRSGYKSLNVLVSKQALKLKLQKRQEGVAKPPEPRA